MVECRLASYRADPVSRYNIIIPADAPPWARQMQAQFNDALNRIALDVLKAGAVGPTAPGSPLFSGSFTAQSGETVTVENGAIVSAV